MVEGLDLVEHVQAVSCLAIERWRAVHHRN